MAASSIPKLNPLYWVLIVGGLLIAFLLLWANRTNALANLGSPTDLIARVSQAIAGAEGFGYGGPNNINRPTRNHNPGDLKKDLTGKGIGVDPDGFIIYANDTDGFEALAKQVSNFFAGSSLYSPSQTIQQTANIYLSGDSQTNKQVWASYVASALGVDVNTTWSQLT